jgi:hypothetical protein
MNTDDDEEMGLFNARLAELIEAEHITRGAGLPPPGHG